jgi:hypothetical protein
MLTGSGKLNLAYFSIFFNIESSKDEWQFTCFKDCDLVKLRGKVVEEEKRYIVRHVAGEKRGNVFPFCFLRDADAMSGYGKKGEMLNIYNSIWYNAIVCCAIGKCREA